MGGEIERDLERLARVLEQIRALEVQQEQQVHSGVQPTVARLVGMGIGSAWPTYWLGMAPNFKPVSREHYRVWSADRAR
ncbi:hypothetical protein [Burkholderia ubonensis]|uniref:hypothetical protein n=1 Tax=Burkholderia ubonensis TaxID=101571 RepID=UPI000AE9CCF2|nr:hypothetical protein [Burkholderia ubonensis]